MYMITLAVWANLTLKWGQGAQKTATFSYIHDTCKDLWWTHFLYINNLHPFPGSVVEYTVRDQRFIRKKITGMETIPATIFFDRPGQYCDILDERSCIYQMLPLNLAPGAPCLHKMAVGLHFVPH